MEMIHLWRHIFFYYFLTPHFFKKQIHLPHQNVTSFVETFFQQTLLRCSDNNEIHSKWCFIFVKFIFCCFSPSPSIIESDGQVCEDSATNIAGSMTCKTFLRSFAYQYCRHKYIRTNCCASHKEYCLNKRGGLRNGRSAVAASSASGQQQERRRRQRQQQQQQRRNQQESSSTTADDSSW